MMILSKQELGKSDGKHFLILFRGAGLQFRGIYCYYVEHEMAVKLHGTGPKTILNEMIDKFFKWVSCYVMLSHVS